VAARVAPAPLGIGLLDFLDFVAAERFDAADLGLAGLSIEVTRPRRVADFGRDDRLLSDRKAID